MVPAASATTTPGEASTPEEDEYRAFLTESGVDPTVHDDLWAKIESGVLPDSATGAEPVETREFIEGSTQVTVHEYEDGSIQRIEVSLPTNPVDGDGISPQNIDQCVLVNSTRTSDTYDNCFISANNLASRASFRTGYTVRSAGSSSVTTGWAESATCYVCTVSQPNAEIVRQHSTSLLPAEVRMQWTASGPGGWPSGTSYLSLRLTQSGLRSTPNNLIPWEN